MHFSEDETRSLRPDESVIVLEDAQMLRQKTKIFYSKFYFLSSKISKCYKLQNSKYPITSEKINPKFTFCCKKMYLDLTVTGLVTQAIIKRRVRMYENKVRSIMHHFLSQLLQIFLKGFEGSLDSENIILK